MAHNHHLWPPKHLEDDRKGAQRFEIESEFISQQRGPAICDDMLVCAYAGKPFIYDPYAAYLYMKAGRLDPMVIVGKLSRQELGAVEIWGAPERILSGKESGLFPAPISTAIRQYYRPGLVNEDEVVYVRKNLDRGTTHASQGNP